MSLRRVVCVDVVPTGSMFDCSVCGKVGRFTCTGCSSIKYCSKPCQRLQWSQHKDCCILVNNNKNETRELGGKLGNFSPFLNPTRPIKHIFPGLTNNTEDYLQLCSYLIKRGELIDSLAVCGLENNSNLAKDLAVGHILDILYIHTGIGKSYIELLFYLLFDFIRFNSPENVKILLEHMPDEWMEYRGVYIYIQGVYCIMYILPNI